MNADKRGLRQFPFTTTDVQQQTGVAEDPAMRDWRILKDQQKPTKGTKFFSFFVSLVSFCKK